MTSFWVCAGVLNHRGVGVFLRIRNWCGVDYCSDGAMASVD